MALEEHAELVVKTKNGESYTIAESRIVKGSLTASSSCSSGGGIPAGACNIGTASVAFRAPSGLTYKKLYRATVEIYAWYQGYSKELYGTYNVSSAENNYGVYTLSLSDNISLLDESCYAANDTENAENWLYSQMAGRWNVPSVILNYICNAYNVPHYNAAENEKFVPDSGNTALSTGVSSECSVESVKDFANYLAEYLGCFIVAAPDGRVRFSRLGEREYKTELNQSNISRGTLQRSPYYVHPSIWKVSFDSGYGSSWYVSSDLPDDAAPLSINITNNPFWQVQEDRVPADIYGGKVTQMIKYMWDYLYNAAVRKDGNTVEYMINPFSCTVHVPYHFRIGDIVTVRDYVNGDVFRSYLTDITWTFRGGQQISCAGDDTRTLSVGTSRSAAKKSNDYSKYLYRKSKTGSSGGDTNTYTKAEIDAKDGTIQVAADKAQETADSAVSVNNTQNTQIAALQKSAHSHSNKDVLDKTEQPYTTAERDKLAGLENYVHPAHTAYNKGMYKVAVDDEGHVTEAETMTKEDIYNAGGVIQSELTFQDYIGDIPLAFMTLFYGGGLRNIAEIGFDRRDDDGKRNFSLKLGGWQDKSTGRLDLVDYIGCQYTITPDPNNSYGTQHYYYVLPAGKSGTIALTSDIPDISGKQDKLTAGTNISISGNTISAKDTTYTSKAAVSGGTDVSLVTTGEKALWNAKTSNIGTITGIKMNGASKGTSGVVDLGTVITAHQDISSKQDKSTAVTHSANTAVGSATKPVYVAANGVATPISHFINSDVPANAKFTDTTYSDATQSTHGLMTAADKKKLDGIAAGATKVAVDSALSATSTNPVQNKAVKAELDSKSASGHTHAMITNSALLVNGANNTAKWVKLGTLVSSGNFSNAMIRVWSGDGANGRANQNSSFEVQIKDGWQSTESATKACAVTVYRINCSSVKVKVIPTAHDTYTVWVYLPWTYWNGNYAVYGKYKSWTPQPLIQSDEPEGTGADTAYYDQAFLTSNVASATKLNTARTLTIGNTGKSFNGAANVSWSLDEIGVLGRTTAGKSYTFNNETVTGSSKDYIFHDIDNNQAGGGDWQFVIGSQNKAFNGNCIFVSGWRNTVQGNQCAAMGQDNIVAGIANIALGSGNQVTADAQGGLSLGNYNTCKANASLSGGWYTEVQKSSNQSIGYGNHITVATASCAAFGAYNGYSFSGPYLSLGNGTESARANAFRAAAAGVYSSGSYHSSGADYAEYFEWMDGNPDGEDRRGRFVKLDGEKILLAKSIDDDILGIVSGNPSVVGDSYEDQWQGQYLTDIYGELLTEDYTDEDGTTRKVWVLNPDYDPDKQYVPRSERQEWSAVGMMGKLIVIDDGTCSPNDYCVPTIGGIATKSDGRAGYRVLSRIDDTHIKVLIKG